MTLALRPAACLLVGLLGFATSEAKTPEVLVVTDLMVPGDQFTPPTADAPCPYVLLPGKSLALGQPIAGERLPDRATVERLLATTLSSQHYQATAPGGPRPRLVLVYYWGEANLDIAEQEETDPVTGETTRTFTPQNVAAFYRVIGFDRTRERGLSLAEEHRMATVLGEDRLYLLVAAVDANALAAGERRLIWRTWISIPSLRHSLTSDLTTMLERGAPFFGRDTPVPQFLDRRAGRAEVQIGETEVVDTLQE